MSLRCVEAEIWGLPKHLHQGLEVGALEEAFGGLGSVATDRNRGWEGVVGQSSHQLDGVIKFGLKSVCNRTAS